MGFAGVYRAATAAGLLLAVSACGQQTVQQPLAAPIDRNGAAMAILPVIENYVPAAQAGVVATCVAQTAPAADITDFVQMGVASDMQTRRILELIKAPAANDCIAKQLL
ncbi:hypothetical protein HJ526_04125 [Donghicola sp. C2-DW-16]|uniref:Succinate dehydrogenase n=1 Tax=Donghicola mangrovi TaxID=2729614 RepID=A0A850PYI4_9RHOB|nr:hypothetical protein [Donghicola mangrovi]NVO21814.1 hypothetical protein [Donghicola mangrovi]NVO26597.1 hypothetical protein [Donghicola mangrovi]